MPSKFLGFIKFLKNFIFFKNFLYIQRDLFIGRKNKGEPNVHECGEETFGYNRHFPTIEIPEKNHPYGIDNFSKLTIILKK